MYSIYICRKCNSTWGGDGSKRICPECGGHLYNTKISVDVWRSKTDLEKETFRLDFIEDLEKTADDSHAVSAAEKTNVIITTTDTVENHEIQEYLGLVHGSDVYQISGSIGGGLNSREWLYGDALKRAQENLNANASWMKADAVVGVHPSIASFGGNINIIVTLTGTAVRLKK